MLSKGRSMNVNEKKCNRIPLEEVRRRNTLDESVYLERV